MRDEKEDIYEKLLKIDCNKITGCEREIIAPGLFDNPLFSSATEKGTQKVMEIIEKEELKCTAMFEI